MWPSSHELMWQLSPQLSSDFNDHLLLEWCDHLPLGLSWSGIMWLFSGLELPSSPGLMWHSSWLEWPLSPELIPWAHVTISSWAHVPIFSWTCVTILSRVHVTIISLATCFTRVIPSEWYVPYRKQLIIFYVMNGSIFFTIDAWNRYENMYMYLQEYIDVPLWHLYTHFTH